MIEIWLVSAVTVVTLLGLLSLITVMIGQKMPEIVAALRPATVRGVAPTLHYAA